jgi:hypothetical protein
MEGEAEPALLPGGEAQSVRNFTGVGGSATFAGMQARWRIVWASRRSGKMASIAVRVQPKRYLAGSRSGRTFQSPDCIWPVYGFPRQTTALLSAFSASSGILPPVPDCETFHKRLAAAGDGC